MATKQEIRGFIREFDKDLRAFNEARDALQRRALAVEDTEHREYFTSASSTQALMHVLNIARVQCEGVLQDLGDRLEEAVQEPPRLTLVDGENKDDGTDNRNE